MIAHSAGSWCTPEMVAATIPPAWRDVGRTVRARARAVERERGRRLETLDELAADPSALRRLGPELLASLLGERSR